MCVCIFLSYSFLQDAGRRNFCFWPKQSDLGKVWLGKGMTTVCSPPPPRANDGGDLCREGWDGSTTGECRGDQRVLRSGYSCP